MEINYKSQLPIMKGNLKQIYGSFNLYRCFSRYIEVQSDPASIGFNYPLFLTWGMQIMRLLERHFG